jgi:hypothetical protein
MQNFFKWLYYKAPFPLLASFFLGVYATFVTLVFFAISFSPEVAIPALLLTLLLTPVLYFKTKGKRDDR